MTGRMVQSRSSIPLGTSLDIEATQAVTSHLHAKIRLPEIGIQHQNHPVIEQLIP